MTRTEIQVDGYAVQLVERTWESAREYRKATRVYVSGAESHAYQVLSAQEAALGDMRWSAKGAFPEVDKLYRKLNTQYGKDCVAAASFVLSEIARTGTVVMGTYGTLKFSRKAGCSCPCSPGVVADGVIYVNHKPVDIYITKI